MDALQENTSDTYHVSRKKGEEGEGDNDVESEGGTEIYETEENGEDGGQINGIRGDVEFVVHLKLVRISREEGMLDEKLINLTLDIHSEHGNPLSLEKAHSSLLVVANAVIFPEKTSITTR